jgi:hypothetical protein
MFIVSKSYQTVNLVEIAGQILYGKVFQIQNKMDTEKWA